MLMKSKPLNIVTGGDEYFFLENTSVKILHIYHGIEVIPETKGSEKTYSLCIHGGGSTLQEQGPGS